MRYEEFKKNAITYEDCYKSELQACKELRIINSRKAKFHGIAFIVPLVAGIILLSSGDPSKDGFVITDFSLAAANGIYALKYLFDKRDCQKRINMLERIKDKSVLIEEIKERAK